MIERHALQCTLRARAEPDLLCAGVRVSGASPCSACPVVDPVFVGNMVEKDIQVLSLDGSTLKDTGVRIAVKGGPAAIRAAAK